MKKGTSFFVSSPKIVYSIYSGNLVSAFDTLHFPRPENCVFPPVGRRKRKYANGNPYLAYG